MLDCTEDLTMSERSKQLKQTFFSLTPAICLESAIAKTKVYQKTEGEENVEGRARHEDEHLGAVSDWWHGLEIHIAVAFDSAQIGELGERDVTAEW